MPSRSITGRLVLGALREQDIAEAANESATRARHLANVARALASSLDEGTTHNAMRRAALPRPASWCVVDVFEPDGSIHRLPAWHPDPVKRDLALTLERRWSREAVARMTQPVYRVAVAGGRFAESVVADAARGDASLRIFRAIGFDSLLVFPLVVRARVHGTITFVSAPRDPPLTDEDIALADGIAAHCAMALDNANLYRQAMVLRVAADAANHAKSVFLATMSHELRTPLNAIGGFAELMDLGLRGPVTEDQHEALRRIKTNQTRLTALISEVLEFADMDSGAATHDEAAMSMPQAIEVVTRRFATAAAAKRLTLATAGSDRSAIARADPAHVHRILIHLVMNAIEHTPAGGGPITLTSRAVGDSVQTCVTDFGPGVSPDRLEAIFQPFGQLTEGLTEHRDGARLGLAISRNLARAMKGDLTVTSTVGLGSQFILTLPRVIAMPSTSAPGGAGTPVAARPTPSRAAGDARPWGGIRLQDVERIVIERTMEATGQNQSAAARMLGISRPTLLRKLRSYSAAVTRRARSGTP